LQPLPPAWPASAARGTVLRIEPPSTTAPKRDDDSDEDDDERPLTREEIRQKTLRALRRRERGKHEGSTTGEDLKHTHTLSGGASGRGGVKLKSPFAKTPGTGRGKENAFN
jgi:hypothetical protein